METGRYATREDLARLETDLVREVRDRAIRLAREMHGLQTRVLVSIVAALLAALTSIATALLR